MIRETAVDNALETEVQPDGFTVTTIDGYNGCQIQCPYCFQLNNPAWSRTIDVRTNIAEVLKKQWECGQLGTTPLYFGSLSDPYMELEREYRLTRKCLQVLSQSDSKVFINTKSDNGLILEDAELLKSFPTPVTVLMGQSNLNQLDNGENSVTIKVANKLHRQKIQVWVFFAPVLPYVMKLDEMILALDEDIPIYIDKLRVMTGGQQDQKLYSWIKKDYPDYAADYEKLLFHGDESYYEQIVQRYKGDSRIKFLFDLWGV